MSHSSNKTTIRRFTYDWLIRFAELCPFETHDAWTVEEFQEGPYNPFTSKYAISPMFTRLITRYMPNLYYMFEVRILNGEIQYPDDLQQPKHGANQKSTVYICGECNLTAVPPGLITSFKNDRVTFYGQRLWLSHNYISEYNRDIPILKPEELRYLLELHHFDKTVNIEATLTETVRFSSIWPLIVRVERVTLKIENLTYEENFATLLHENRDFPSSLYLWVPSLSDQAVLEIFDFVLSLPVHPHWMRLRLLQMKEKSLGDAIIEKYRAAEFPKTDLDPPTGMFDTIECCDNNIDDDKLISCMFKTLNNTFNV